MHASEMRYNIDKKNPNLGAAANRVHQNNNKGLSYNLCINLICMFMNRNKLMFLIRENQNITGITSSICFLWLQNISIFLISSYVKEDKDKSQ